MDWLALIITAIIVVLGYTFIWAFEKLLGAWLKMTTIFKSCKDEHFPRSKSGFVVDVKNKKVIDTPGKPISPSD
jgi:hypothetical protein